MHHNVDPAIGELLAGVRSFISREIEPLAAEHSEVIRAERLTPEYFELCQRVQRRSVEAGYYAMFMPEDLGGAGLGEYEMCLVREEVARFGNQLAMLMLGDLPL